MQNVAAIYIIQGKSSCSKCALFASLRVNQD